MRYINIELEIIASLVEEKKLNLEQLKTIMKIKKKENNTLKIIELILIIKKNAEN